MWRPEPPAAVRARRGASRGTQFALFSVGLLWLLASRVGAESAAMGFSRLFRSDVFAPLLSQLFAVVLLLTGFTALNWLLTRDGSVRRTNALPVRPTAGREAQKGVALGWALLLASVLPLAVFGALEPQFWWAPKAFGLALVSLVTVFLASLAAELAFRGFLLQRLAAALGPVSAAVLLSALYAGLLSGQRPASGVAFAVSFTAGLLYSMAYLRTHALWLPWGLHFGWLASAVVLFGLPEGGLGELANVVATRVSGPAALTGGEAGLQGAVWTGVVFFAGLFALYRVTREYAWAYTHPPIVPGGYAMDVPPPAAHAAMAAAAPPPPPLVQIAPFAPPAGGAPPAPHVVETVVPSVPGPTQEPLSSESPRGTDER